MKGISVWFFLSCKRYLRKFSFLLILLVLPAATFAIRKLEREEGQEVRIAVCTEGEETVGKRQSGKEPQDPLEEMLAESLARQDAETDRGLFRFYRCEDEEQVKAQVASGQAECGYVISGDLRRKLEEQNYKRCIRVYSAPSTVLAELSTEVVFAALMKLYDREIFLDYVAKSELVQKSELGAKPEPEAGSGTGTRVKMQSEAEQGAVQDSESGNQVLALAGELYDKWMNNGSTFRFEYRRLSRAEREKEREGKKVEQEPVRVFPVRGIVAVYLLLAGLYSAVMLGTDEQNGLFVPLSPGMRLACRLAALAAPVFLSALSALGALKTGGCMQEPVREIIAMGSYVVAVCLFAWGMKSVCRRPQAVCCMIPLFLVGSLVFTPVFVDIRQFLPALGWVEKLFLPSYYLRVF